MTCYGQHGVIKCTCSGPNRYACMGGRRLHDFAAYLAQLGSDEKRTRELSVMRLRSVEFAEKARALAHQMIEQKKEQGDLFKAAA